MYHLQQRRLVAFVSEFLIQMTNDLILIYTTPWYCNLDSVFLFPIRNGKYQFASILSLPYLYLSTLCKNDYLILSSRYKGVYLCYLIYEL